MGYNKYYHPVTGEELDEEGFNKLALEQGWSEEEKRKNQVGIELHDTVKPLDKASIDFWNETNLWEVVKPKVKGIKGKVIITGGTSGDFKPVEMMSYLQNTGYMFAGFDPYQVLADTNECVNQDFYD